VYLSFSQSQSQSNAGYDFAIIGGGFSAACLAIHLMRGAQGKLSIAIIDRDGLIGRGVAYRTQCMAHILNVPAAKMSILADEPDHFADWIANQDFEPHHFVPRRCYGEYIEEVLLEVAQASRHATVNWVQGNVVAARRSQGGVAIELENGDVIHAGTSILAVGNAPPQGPEVFQSLNANRYNANPWANHLEIAPNDDVLIVGSGLTAIDQILALSRENDHGTIYVLSRRGKLPALHGRYALWPTEWADALPSDALGLFRAVRCQIKEAQATGADWRAVIDSMRCATPRIWKSLSPEEKERFIRHVRPYWEITRHRIPARTHEELEFLIADKRLVMLAGRITQAVDTQEHVEVAYTDRKTQSNRAIRVDRVLNCTGPGTVARVRDELLNHLLEDGLARLDSLGLGIETAADGALIDSDGRASETMFAIGPVRKATLWETTAVGEIRAQANELAKLLGSRIADAVLR
jgi:uncharacterized NAD(P)/FAD-binding protein YdhS